MSRSDRNSFKLTHCLAAAALARKPAQTVRSHQMAKPGDRLHRRHARSIHRRAGGRHRRAGGRRPGTAKLLAIPDPPRTRSSRRRSSIRCRDAALRRLTTYLCTAHFRFHLGERAAITRAFGQAGDENSLVVRQMRRQSAADRAAMLHALPRTPQNRAHSA
jgi:hypothetical protein